MDTRIAALARGRYISLTTYRRDGRAVATPVWFALDGSRIIVWTDAASGKAKRVRANGRAAIAASDGRGRTRQPPMEARARVLPESEFGRANGILTAKYRWLKPLVDRWTTLNIAIRRKPRPVEVYIELQLVGDSE